jgi:hypothetical protein
MNGKRLLTAAAGALVAVGIAGGVAYATIPGPGNVYSACLLKGVGTIRLIDKSLPSTNLMSRCTDKETEISWNQAGQAGPAGPAGAKGEPGAPGKDGANGTNGTNGTIGEDGVSVTTASEPAGANCAGGGVQLSAVNGVTYVCNGKDGVDGEDGAEGARGADGHDGASVTSAPEAAGSNCANGGSKFTAANGVTYACNGAPGSGGGPTGQDATSVFGTASVTVGSSTGPTNIPGLTQTIAVPADAVVYIASDGGLTTNSSSTTGFSAVDVFVTVDGQNPASGLFRAITCANSGGIVGVFCSWSLSAALPLGQGSHTITVQVMGINSIGGANATVSGDNQSAHQGALTVMVLKK